jgi:hypothetical protein
VSSRIRRVFAEQTDPDFGLFEGVIAQNAEHVNDQILVIIPAHDGDQAFGPASFHPRVADDGSVELPQEHDRCCVALAKSVDPGEPAVFILTYTTND